MKTETCKLCLLNVSFNSNIFKIDTYDFELYRFKVGTFFRDTVYIIL